MAFNYYKQTDPTVLFGAFNMASDGSVTFPNTPFYGGAFLGPTLTHLCTNKGGAYNIYYTPDGWGQLCDMITGEKWTRLVSREGKPSVQPNVPAIANVPCSDSMKGMMAVVSKLYQLTQQEEMEFGNLLDGEKIRTPFAVQQTTTMEIEQLPRLFPYRKMYATLREMANKKNGRVGKVQTFGSSYKEKSGKIWNVTSSSTNLFTLYNTTDYRTADGFKIYNSYIGEDVFWILFHNGSMAPDEVLGGITSDDYNTMPLSNGYVFTKYT